jgi:hypothetical protein
MGKVKGRLTRLFVADASDPGTWIKVRALVDAGLNGTRGEINATTVDSGDWEEYEEGLRSATIEANLRWDEADPGQALLASNFFTSAPELLVKFMLQPNMIAKEWVGKGFVTKWNPTSGGSDMANLAVFAKEALDNKKIKDVFAALDAAIVGAEQVFAITGSTLDKVTLDKLALYTLDQVDTGDAPFAFGLNKYAQAIANIAGYTSYMSDSMKDAYNRYGLIKEYGGLLIAGFSGAKKAADGELLVPD